MKKIKIKKNMKKRNDSINFNEKESKVTIIILQI